MSSFYKQRKKLKEEFPFLNLTFYVKFWIILVSILVVITLVTAFSVIVQQLYFIYNDLGYYETVKNPNKETYWCCCRTKNQTKEVFEFI